MATHTVKLNLAKSAYVTYANPDTHYGTSSSTQYYLSGVQKLLFKFAAWPSNLRHNKLENAEFHMRLHIGNVSCTAYLNAADFNPDTVTYNTKPAIDSSFHACDFYSDDFLSIGYPHGTWQDASANITPLFNILKRGITIQADSSGTTESDKWYGKTALSNGDPIYLLATYNDTKVTSQVELVSGPTGSGHSTLAGKTFSWRYVQGSAGTCYDPTWAQASAKIWWKASDSNSWNSINISGTSLSYTTPAETFPPGKTIEYYIQGTDEDGTTTTTGTSTFSTVSASLSLTSYPSGSDVYSGQALSFYWDILENGQSLTQSSAILYWKKQSASSYTTASVSGNTKRITVPAYTFSTGSVIEWYVTVTDKTGVSYTSTAKTFTTSAPSVHMATYPSGNAVYYGGILSFTWDLSDSHGNYSQASGTLYWRASTSDPWTAISAGTTKGVNVPAYTFLANATITWYVTATDNGGTTSSSNQMSFKTASPVIEPQDSPTSGYADPRSAITFRWFFSDGQNSYQQQSAEFKWRVSGESAWNSVSASGTTQSVTIAANTFPTLSIIEWMVGGTVRNGSYSETTIYSFSTTAETAYAICQAPIGRAEDGSKDIVLRWTVRNADGSDPSRTIVKWKKSTEAATEWRTVLDTTDTVYSLTISGGTFPAGGIDWQVTAYNRDSAAGPTSLASFVCIIAPAAPLGLSATVVPRTTVSWQASGQAGFEIEIDGVIERAGYGPDINSWQRSEPLEDGVHTVRVRIQGDYGHWSEWAETFVAIVNEPDGTITLTGAFTTDGDLSWSYDGSADPEIVAVYRDGKWIGTATGKTSFTDRFVLGEHVYRVEYWYASGFYTRSNDLTGSMDCDTLLISAFPDGSWLPLKLSETSDRKQTFSWSKQNAMHSITGSLWPVLEMAPYESLSASYDCAFADAGSIREFLQLRGKIVILKSPGENVVIGGLTATKKTVGEFYTTFGFSVQQCHWEDFIHDDADD